MSCIFQITSPPTLYTSSHLLLPPTLPPTLPSQFRVEFELGTSGLTYTPGDALGIYPRNCPAAVDELLQVTGVSGDVQVPAPAWAYPGADGAVGREVSLREALITYYDLR